MMIVDRDVSDLRVLVVEDEYLIADDLKCLIRSSGAAMVRLCGTKDAALHQIERDVFNFALVDINLAGQSAYAVADALRRRGIPFAFLSGYDDTTLPARFSGTPFWQKPVDRRRLMTEIEQARRA